MAVIKVFSARGVKKLNCFDTLSEVEYLTQADQESFDYETLPDLQSE